MRHFMGSTFASSAGILWLAVAAQTASVKAEPACQTAFARVVKVELQKLVAQHKDDACKVLKFDLNGLKFAVDHTKELTLNSTDICEDGPKLTFSGDFTFACSTGDSAVIKTSVSSEVTASTTVDFHGCTVDALDIKAKDSTVQSAIEVFHATAKATDFLKTTITPYCDH